MSLWQARRSTRLPQGSSTAHGGLTTRPSPLPPSTARASDDAACRATIALPASDRKGRVRSCASDSRIGGGAAACCCVVAVVVAPPGGAAAAAAAAAAAGGSAAPPEAGLAVGLPGRLEADSLRAERTPAASGSCSASAPNCWNQALTSARMAVWLVSRRCSCLLWPMATSSPKLTSRYGCCCAAGGPGPAAEAAEQGREPLVLQPPGPGGAAVLQEAPAWLARLSRCCCCLWASCCCQGCCTGLPSASSRL
jgi:hypothetical protein